EEWTSHHLCDGPVPWPIGGASAGHRHRSVTLSSGCGHRSVRQPPQIVHLSWTRPSRPRPQPARAVDETAGPRRQPAPSPSLIPPPPGRTLPPSPPPRPLPHPPACGDRPCVRAASDPLGERRQALVVCASRSARPTCSIVITPLSRPSASTAISAPSLLKFWF